MCQPVLYTYPNCKHLVAGQKNWGLAGCPKYRRTHRECWIPLDIRPEEVVLRPWPYARIEQCAECRDAAARSRQRLQEAMIRRTTTATASDGVRVASAASALVSSPMAQPGQEGQQYLHDASGDALRGQTPGLEVWHAGTDTTSYLASLMVEQLHIDDEWEALENQNERREGGGGQGSPNPQS